MASEQTTPVKKYLPRLIVLVIVVAVAFYGFQSYRYNQHYETTDNAQIEGNTAPVLARVAGYVQQVSIEDYTAVKRGQELITVDPQEYEVALQQAEADVQSLRVSKAANDLKRDENLYKGQSLTQKQLEDSRNNSEVQARQFDSNVQQVGLAKTSEAVAQATIAKAQANILKAQAQLKLKQAAIDNAKLRLGYAKITAPISGKIGKKNVIVGQYVQPGQNLFTIVNDSTFWVVANFKETQLEHMRVGQPVDVKIDAYPDLEVKGKVVSLSDATGAKFALLPADNASGNFVKVTQRVPVKIEIENPAKYKDLLRAGLSTDVAVKVQ
jgi:membrane fusion protein (multidrug efflux system)